MKDLVVPMARVASIAGFLGFSWMVSLARAEDGVQLPTDASAKDPPSQQGGETPARLGEVVVTGRADSLIGIADTAAEGTVGAEELRRRPILRPGELAETVPGLIITQHSGSGKANQFYLRGFNLDHGTDLATFIGGVPVNLPTHAHGQGYTDLNFLIPELVETIRFRKGPYYADVGDFASTGDVRLDYFSQLPRTIAKVEAGTFGYERGLLASSVKVGPGTLLYAAEVMHDDGPWVNPDNYRKYNALLRYSQGSQDQGFSFTANAYHGEWNSTDQIARRAVDQGLISRLGFLDESDGGDSQRYGASGEWHSGDDSSMTRALVYSYYYDLDLFSNFTYFLDDPVNGDQFEQKDRRVVSGASLSHEWSGKFWGDRDVKNTLGFQVRNDWVQNGLFHTQERHRFATTRRDHTLETAFGPYFEHRVQLLEWLRGVAGVRGDLYHFDVDSDRSSNSDSTVDVIPSPKASLVFGPWARTELYLSGGFGFHSNDARGVTTRVDPASLTRVKRADPLVETKGAEAGVRTLVLPGLQSTLSYWVLESDSELLFVGDAGTTEASRPSRRHGVEWANFYEPLTWLTVDADLAFSQARFTDSAPEGDHIPGAVESVIALGVSFHDLQGFFGSLRLRYFGPRPLIEDNSVRSSRTTLVNAQVGYAFNENWRVAFEVFNLLNSKDNDIEYFYASRLQGEGAGGVEDRHFHPVEPISFRIGLEGRF